VFLVARSRNDILFKFLGDTKSLDRASRKARGDFKETEKSAGGVSSAVGGISKAFIAMGGAYAASRALDWVGDATQMAAKAEQVAGSFDKVFGPAADGLRDSLEDMRQSVGLNTLEFESLLQQNGNLLTGFGLTSDATAEMSTELFTAAADLAAFKGDTGLTAEALHALNRALVGEFDPLEQFIGGVKASTISAKALELGLAETTAELTEQDKALALLEIVTGDAQLATGAFADTQGTLQDQTNRATVALEDAKLELGEALAPAMLTATQNTVKLYQSLAVMTDDAENAATKARALGDAWDATAGQFGFVTDDFMYEINRWTDAIGGVEHSIARLKEVVSDFIGSGFRNPFRDWKLPSISMPHIPGFATGGTVPGPVGQPSLAVVHGGEQVLTPGQQRQGRASSNGGVVINVNGALDPVAVAQQITDMLELYGMTDGLR